MTHLWIQPSGQIQNNLISLDIGNILKVFFLIELQLMRQNINSSEVYEVIWRMLVLMMMSVAQKQLYCVSSGSCEDQK